MYSKLKHFLLNEIEAEEQRIHKSTLTAGKLEAYRKVLNYLSDETNS